MFASLALLVIIAGGYFALEAYPASSASAAIRSGGIVLRFIEDFIGPSPYVPFWTMLGAAVYSFIGVIFIYYFFEKTQSPEILFIGLFVVSLSFEFTRIMIPLKQVLVFSSLYLVTLSRVLLFGRYFGLFSLFAASVYAAGLDAQKQQNGFFVVVLAALIIALRVPIDSLVWDSSLKMLNGYGSMFAIVEAGILVVTVITFVISAYTRSSRSYLLIALGTFLVYSGRNILISSDTWITLVPGLLLLAASTWFVCERLHREYLWI